MFKFKNLLLAISLIAFSISQIDAARNRSVNLETGAGGKIRHTLSATVKALGSFGCLAVAYTHFRNFTIDTEFKNLGMSAAFVIFSGDLAKRSLASFDKAYRA